LKDEVEEFLENVGADRHFAPNRIVSKSKRSKWRFEVKWYIKDLLACYGENSDEAASLLAEIYRVLSEACAIWLLVTDNPFSTLGYQQQDLFKLVVDKILAQGFTPEAIETSCLLSIESRMDAEECLHRYLNRVLVDTNRH
jgi:hypothetical protein